MTMSDAPPPVERITTYASSWEAWRNRIGILLWLIGTVLLFVFASRLSVPVLLVCGMLWIGVLGLVASKSWLLFLGPVFFYDAIRLGRRRWVFWFRCLFAGILGMILLMMYRAFVEYSPFRGDGAISIAEYARFAEEFFHTFVTIQFIILCLLTPVYIAPAIAEEKERRTLEFLFATDLRNREILFGKLVARLGTLMLFLLAGLPILTLTQFFGGVDPNQVIIYTLGTLILVLFLASIAIWCSVSIKKSRDAIALAFLIPLAYHALTAILYGLARQAQMYPTYWMNDSITLFGSSISTVDVFLTLSRGNLFPLMLELDDAVRAGAFYEVEAWRLLGHYALFHVISIAFFLYVAVIRLRPLGLKQTSNETKSKPRRGRTHPKVGDRPMIWKEIYVESSFRGGWAGRVILVVIALLSFIPAFIITYEIFFDKGATYYLRPGRSQWDEYAYRMNLYLRSVSTIVASLLLLGAAIRGAGTVRGEKDKQTFDSLMTSPLSVRQILWGKWWGCMLGNRFGLLWLGTIWLIGLASGGLHPGALLLLLMGMGIFMSGYAWIGIWCSISCSTTLRATTWALVGAILFGGGYLILFSLCCFSIGPRNSEDRVLMNLLPAFSPPVLLSYLPFSQFDEEQLRFIGTGRTIWAVYALIGCTVWVMVSFVLQNVCILKFRRDNNRMGYREDDPLNQWRDFEKIDDELLAEQRFRRGKE